MGMAAKLIDHFCGDVDEALRHLTDKYLGAYGSLTEYASESILAQIEGKIPDLVAPYVDYEAIALILQKTEKTESNFLI